MAWSGGTYRKGNYSTNGWTGDASLGIGIEAGRHDTQDDDFMNGINQSLNKDGSNAATGNLNIGSNRLTNVSAGTARTDAINLSQVQDSSLLWGGTSGGAANAQTLTPSPAITAYVAGQMFRFIAGFTSTGAVTLQVSGLASPVTCLMKNSKVALGTLAPVMAGLTYEALYDGTNFLISDLLDLCQYTNDAVGSRLKLHKSRGTTAGSNVIVQNGDALGQIDFYGASGSEYTRGAFINATVTGTPGATNDMPTSLTFAVTADGSGTPTEQMRIINSGKIGFGTSAPTSFYEFNRNSNDNGTSLGILNANSGSSAASVFYLGNNSSAVGSGLIYNSSANATNAGANGLTLYQGIAGGKIRVQAVSAGVELLAGATSWSAVSDERLKKNIKPLEYGLSDVLQINPVRFDYKTDESDDSKRLGFIAQELQPVIPEAVGGNEETFYGVSATELIPALIKAIKELNAKVETLEARIAALEA